MRLVCSTATFPEDRLEMAIAKSAWAGYSGVELALDREPLPEESRVTARLRAEGLELAAVFAGTLPADAVQSALDELARIGRAAALTRALDGPLVILRGPQEGSLRSLAQNLRTLDGVLANVNVSLCLANRQGTLLPRPCDFHELWQLGVPERTAIALDPADALLTGWDVVDLDSFPALPRHVYLTDARNGKRVPPGEGDVDLERLGSALRMSGYTGSISLVLEGAAPWEIEPMAREIGEAARSWFPV